MQLSPHCMLELAGGNKTSVKKRVVKFVFNIFICSAALSSCRCHLLQSNQPLKTRKLIMYLNKKVLSQHNRYQVLQIASPDNTTPIINHPGWTEHNRFFMFLERRPFSSCNLFRVILSTHGGRKKAPKCILWSVWPLGWTSLDLSASLQFMPPLYYACWPKNCVWTQKNVD